MKINKGKIEKFGIPGGSTGNILRTLSLIRFFPSSLSFLFEEGKERKKETEEKRKIGAKEITGQAWAHGADVSTLMSSSFSSLSLFSKEK